jgi:hypothetical protein
MTVESLILIVSHTILDERCTNDSVDWSWEPRRWIGLHQRFRKLPTDSRVDELHVFQYVPFSLLARDEADE